MEHIKQQHAFSDKIINTVQALIVGLNPDGTIGFFNDRCEQVTGWKREEAMGRNWFENFIPERLRPPLGTVFQDLLDSIDDNEYENAILARSGEERIIAWRNTVLRDTSGEVSLVIGTGIDVTERRQSDDLLHSLNAAALAVQRVLEPQEIFEVTARELGNLGFECTVLLRDEGQDTLRVVFTTFEAQAINAAEERTGLWMIGHRVLIEPLGKLGTVCRDRQAVLISEARGGTQELPLEQLPGLGDQNADVLPLMPFIAAPMMAGDELLGALFVHSQTLQERHLPAVTAFANQVAISIENARLFVASERQTQELAGLYDTALAIGSLLETDMLLERLYEHVRQLMGPDGFGVVLYDADAEELEIALAMEEGEIVPEAAGMRAPIEEGGLTGWVIRTRRPLLAGDLLEEPLPVEPRHLTRPARAWLGVPLIARDRLIGAISAQSFVPYAFDHADRRFLESLAAQVAVAIENARLFEAERAQARRQTALSQISAELAVTLDEEEVCQRVVKDLHVALDYGFVGLFLIDASSGERVLTASAGWSDAPDNWRIPFFDQRFHQTPDVTCGQRCICGPNSEEVAVPLRIGDRVIGVLVVESKHPHTFSQGDCELLTATANQAAIAIENARLYDAQRQQADDIARLHRASDTLFFTATTDPRTLAQTIAEAVLREFGQANCSLFLLKPTTGELERVGASGPYVPQVTQARLTLDGKGLVPRAVRTNQIVNVPDVLADPDYLSNWDEARSEMAVPLRVGDCVVGALDVQSNQLAAFGPIDERLLSAFADRAAITIENARLYQAIQEYAASLQAATREKEELLEQLQRHAENLEHEVVLRTAEIFAEKIKVETILKSAGDAIVITDSKNRISYVNDAFCELTGYTLEEIVGQTAQKALFPNQTPPATRTEIEHAMTHALSWRGDILTKHKDGHVIETEMTLAPVRDADGQTLSFVSSLRDVTTVRALERAKSEFLTNVTHQLRTPVTNLKTYTYLLNKSSLEKQARYMEILSGEVDKFILLVQDLLEIAELDAGPILTVRRPVSPIELVNVVTVRCQSQAEMAGVALNAVLPEEMLPMVLGSEKRLAQALNQIVDNALLYTTHGKITVGARLVNSTQSGTGEIVLWVSDTGPGISPSEQEQVFDRFFRGKAAEPGHIPGTGLGLAIARMIVEAHQGHIELRSTVGQGSIFEIWLPVAP